MPNPGPDPWPGPKSKTCARTDLPLPPGARVPERATINALRGPSSAHAHGEKLTRRYGVAIGVSDASCLVAVRCGFGCRMRCCVHPCQRAHPSPPHASVTLLFGHDPLAGPRPSTQEKQKEPRVCAECAVSSVCRRPTQSYLVSALGLCGLWRVPTQRSQSHYTHRCSGKTPKCCTV